MDTIFTNSHSIALASIINNHPQQVCRSSNRLKDYIRNHISLSTDFSLAKYISLSHLRHFHRAFLTNILENQEPRFYSQSMKFIERRNAMAKGM